MKTMAPEVERVQFADLCRFEPKQVAASRAAAAHKFTLYGGARGPGKSYWLRWYLLRRILKRAARGITGVVAGLFCEDYPTLKDRQIGKIEAEFPNWLGELKDSLAHGLGFHLRPEYGGGVLALRNLDKPEKYQSAEFADIGVDELTKNDVTVFNALRGSLRWPGLPDSDCKFVAGSNPGGIGHLWVRDYWGVDKDQALPAEMQTLADQFTFVRALPDDNPHLDAAYWNMLNTLTPDLARAWRWGDWNVFVGQVLDLRRGRHFIDPIELPLAWPRWRAVDWGSVAPFVCGWACRNPDIGRVYVYRALHETGLTDRQQARLIVANSPPSEKVRITYGDPSMWTRKTHEDKTFSTADEYRAEGVPLVEADNDRMTGLRKIKTLLADLPDGLPGLQIFNTCTDLVRTLPALTHDPVHVEDVDTDGDDHDYDMLRYLLTNVRPPSPRPVVVQVVDSILKRAQKSTGLGSRDL